MKRVWIVLAAAALAFGLASPASAADGSLEGNTDYIDGCEEAGGTFEAVDPPAGRAGDQCTIVTGGTDTETLPGSHPNKPWTVVVEITNQTTTVYEIEQVDRLPVWKEISSETIGGPGTGVVISCANHQGNAIGGFANNPHCKPST